MKKMFVLPVVLSFTFINACGGGGSESGSTIESSENTLHPIAAGLWIIETKDPQWVIDVSGDSGSNYDQYIVNKSSIVHDIGNEWISKACGSSIEKTYSEEPSLEAADGMCNFGEVTMLSDYSYQVECPGFGQIIYYKKVSDTPSFQGEVTILADGETIFSSSEACSFVGFHEDLVGNVITKPYYELRDSEGNDLLSFRFENGYPTPGTYTIDEDIAFDLYISSEHIVGGELTVTRVSEYFLDATFDIAILNSDTLQFSQIVGTIQFPY